MLKRLSILAVASLMLPALAMADTFVDDFEGGTNVGGWYYNHNETIELAGGNPGAWLHNGQIDNFAVIFKSDWAAPEFTGDYTGMGVTNVGFDARLDMGNIPMYMSILLRDTNGTPANVDDDDYVYMPNGLIPQTPGVWESYDFVVPSQSNELLPAGWWGGWVGDGENLRPGIEWSDVMASVDRVEIWFWHPAYFGIFRQWDAGLDNVSITTDGTVSVEETTWGSVKGLYR